MKPNDILNLLYNEIKNQSEFKFQYFFEILIKDDIIHEKLAGE